MILEVTGILALLALLIAGCFRMGQVYERKYLPPRDDDVLGIIAARASIIERAATGARDRLLEIRQLSAPPMMTVPRPLMAPPPPFPPANVSTTVRSRNGAPHTAAVPREAEDDHWLTRQLSELDQEMLSQVWGDGK